MSIFYFILEKKKKKKAEALTNDAVMNLLRHYSNRFGEWDVRLDLTEILERHGDNKYYIYRKICQFKNFTNFKKIFY